jgi:hypothetical protein
MARSLKEASSMRLRKPKQREAQRPDAQSVNILPRPVRRSTKGIKGSLQVIAENSTAAAHRYFEGVDGPVMAWARRFTDKKGQEFVHMSYHTLNMLGKVALGQFGPMMPTKAAGELVGRMIENLVVDLSDVFSQISMRTLLKLLTPEQLQELRTLLN